MSRNAYPEAKPFHVAGNIIFSPRRRDAVKVLCGWAWCFTYRHEWPSGPPLDAASEQPRLTRDLHEIAPVWWEMLRQWWPFG